MKKHALRFTNCDTAELWEILPEFANTAKMYQDFVDAVYKLYLGSDLEQQWVIADMDKLVGETLRVGILSLMDLGKYHREFMAITTFLIAKNHISIAEQRHAFAHGFPPELWNRIAHRLQLKLPDHFPDNPYTLEEIHDTVRFVLHGTVLYALAYDDQRQAAQTSAAVTKAEPTIKTEDFTALLDVMKQAVSKMGNQGNQSKPSPPHDLCCHFCGKGHFKNSCDVLKEYIHDGKCILCNDGRITLPGRRFIPGRIAGKTFKGRLNEWHRQKPEVTYRTSAPIYDPQVTSNIYSRTMNLQITLTQRELLSLLLEVRSQVCKATSNQRVPWVSVQTASSNQNFVDTIMSIELDNEEGD